MSSRYEPSWVIDLDMGPNPLWQLEDLLPDLALEAGMRVLDLGAGRGATSVFLAQECGVEVVALDLWVPAEQARRVHETARVADRVTAVHGDIRSAVLEGLFDAVVSIDAFEYFGTDVCFLPSLLRLLRPGGRLGISTPGLRSDPYESGIPEFVRSVVGWEAAAWHSPSWWARHWELTGLLENINARWQVGGGQDWRLWTEVVAAATNDAGLEPIASMLEADSDSELGFVLVTACKASSSGGA